MKTRRQARVLALEALFEVDSVNHPPDLVLRQRLDVDFEGGRYFSITLQELHSLVLCRS